ncbi:hypothetical protein [Absidia glauca]|uniref:JmjC domain-containing protein n=1 Tax=Absidia glauca TaxID=4829 RepID=A0A163MDC5_ABSGL|nr:hypothetical protein [Absidia glauca]
MGKAKNGTAKASPAPLEIQHGRCNHVKYQAFPNPCLACISEIESDPCRFNYFRAFKRRKTTLEYGPYFVFHRRRYFSLQSVPISNLPTLTKTQQIYIQDALRPTVKRLLDQDLLLMDSLIDTIVRRTPTNNVRHTCDNCLTSIFNVYYMCGLCGLEICVDCFGLDSEWTDDNANAPLTSDLTICSYERRHNKPQFFPVHKYSMADLLQLRLQTSVLTPNQRPPLPTNDSLQSPKKTTPPLIGDPSSSNSSPMALSWITSAVPSQSKRPCISTLSPSQLPLSPNTSIESPDTGLDDDHHERTLTLPPQSPLPFESSLGANSIPAHLQLLVISQRHLSLDQFQTYWQTGKPALVQDTLDRSRIAWTPDFFCSLYGKQKIDAIDCHNMEVTSMTINDFFKGYVSRKQSDSTIPLLKIKDWPPGSDFRTECPEMYQDFMAMLPAPEYCTANGAFNLSNRLPPFFLKPDLGPKMFIAYGLDPLDDTCHVGTTNLHCDMTDAVNVMCHAQGYGGNTGKKYELGVSATTGIPAAAVWDVFAFEDLPTLRRFVGQLWNEMHGPRQSPRINSSQPSSKVDPIHGQWIYLTKALLLRLDKEHGVKPWRLYQNPGDAIYIPAGCAHQVANYQNAIKCAFDFVSPENINRSAEITRQFGHAQREDALQLKTTLVYAWMSVYKSTSLSIPTSTLDDFDLKSEDSMENGKRSSTAFSDDDADFDDGDEEIKSDTNVSASRQKSKSKKKRSR